MKLIERGAGRPRVAIVGGIHGDEPAGEVIVERLMNELDVDAGTVQLIIANEPALEAGVRYTETDLNRAFPGNTDADEYETALAARIYAILDGADAILALHTSQSAPPPFAIYSNLTDSVRKTVTALPVEYTLDSSNLRGTTLDSVLPHAVSLEAGGQQTEGAIRFGYDASLEFLRAHGILHDGEATYTETRVVQGHREVPKGGGKPQLYFENFEEMPKGEVFAQDDEVTHRVEEEGLVPVLASEHGYTDIFGLYGSFDGTVEPPETV